MTNRAHIIFGTDQRARPPRSTANARTARHATTPSRWAAAQCAQCLLIGTAQRQIGSKMRRGQRTDAGVSQRLQDRWIVASRAPDAKLVKRRIGRIDPAVAIDVERRQFAETVVGGRTEQFLAGIDAAIGIAIENQISTA